MKSTHNHCTGLIPLLTLALAVFVLVGCEKKPEKPKISEIFKTQLLQYLKDGGKLSTQSGEGINLFTLRSQLTDAKSTFDLLEATWPTGLAPAARESFKKSHEGYDLAIELWKDKIDRADTPIEPNINGWSRYQTYAGGALVIETRSSDGGFEEYRGKRYLPFDKNISVLLTIAGAHFDKGRKAVLSELE